MQNLHITYFKAEEKKHNKGIFISNNRDLNKKYLTVISKEHTYKQNKINGDA